MDLNCRSREKKLVKKWKLRWFGNVSKSSGLAKTILQETVKGKRRGRHKKRWEDNIKEWTEMEFVSSTRAAENRTRWKGIVANSSVVPRWPSPLMTKFTSILGGKNLCFLEFLPIYTFY